MRWQGWVHVQRHRREYVRYGSVDGTGGSGVDDDVGMWMGEEAGWYHPNSQVWVMRGEKGRVKDKG